MYTAVVELDTLTDTDGAGAEYDNFFLVGVQVFNKLCSFVVVVVKGAVEILHLVFALIFIIFGCVLFSKNFNSTQITWKIIPGIIVVIIGLIIACNVDYYTMLMGLINPEFGAINYILEFVKA